MRSVKYLPIWVWVYWLITTVASQLHSEIHLTSDDGFEIDLLTTIRPKLTVQNNRNSAHRLNSSASLDTINSDDFEHTTLLTESNSSLENIPTYFGKEATSADPTINGHHESYTEDSTIIPGHIISSEDTTISGHHTTTKEDTTISIEHTSSEDTTIFGHHTTTPEDTTISGHHTTTPEDTTNSGHHTTTPEDTTISGHHTTTPEDTTISIQHTSSKDSTAIFGHNTTTPEDTTISEHHTLSAEDTTIIFVHHNSSPEAITILGTTNTNAGYAWDVCPKFNTKQVPETLVKCQCNGNEILKDGECQSYAKGTFIDVEEFPITKKVPVSNDDVIIRNVTCDPGKTRFLQVKRGQFRIRSRGDVVLESVGHLQALRINNYCVTHLLGEDGDLAWIMNACIPVPAVPRCCPRGQAMKDGSCQKANTPETLRPPISADPYSLEGIEWPDITNFMSPLTCTVDPVKTIPSEYKDSSLVSLPNGIQHSWIPRDVDDNPIFHSCPDFCVDGIVNSDGSVSYFTSFCYSHPKEHHEKLCRDQTCIRKCCKEEEIYENNTFTCIPDPESHFAPETQSDITHYTIVTGEPFCDFADLVPGTFTIDNNGFMVTADGKYPATDYCVDNFIHNDILEMGALVCHFEGSLWTDVKGILVPICYGISLIFLSITIACHILVPEIQKNGGVHQFCHALALSTAYLSSFTDYVYHNSIMGHTSCFVVASVTQFGFLATFFWLNVMCFENWQKIRCLRKMLPSKQTQSSLYLLYAWGIPFIICAVTVAMQHLLPEDAVGVIRPDIGLSRCFLNDDAPFFAYFFGPVIFLLICNAVFLTLTQVNFCMMLQEYKNITNDLKDLGTGEIATAPQATSSMPSRQITNHVNEYKQRLQLFVLMAVCWVTEVLSWKIPPPELWAPTDTLNALQGFFIFIIFLSNRNKRKIIEKKFPRVYKSLSRGPLKLKQLMCGDGTSTSLSQVGSLSSSVGRKISTSTLITNFTSVFRTSTSSLSINDPPKMSQRSVSLDESLKGIVTLSHTPLRNTKSDSGILELSSY